MENECPYIETGTKVMVCGACMTSTTPCASEFTPYCATEDHYRCPILLARVLREGSAERLRRTAPASCR